ncbi:MAG: glycosyltransferase [Deltaproteobacteria bacterium]|jgi:spore maturation protein CgeB|nr:glycosyltransferase [Deltaproteobacteria bacterium]
MATFQTSTMSSSKAILDKNMAALGQTKPEAAAWLAQPKGKRRKIEAFEAEDGCRYLVVDGVSQDTRKNPRLLAKKLLAEIPNLFAAGRVPVLFGLGNISVLEEALGKLQALTVFEPDPEMAEAVLSLLDLSDALTTGRLRLVTPWDLYRNEAGFVNPILISPAAAKRRHLAAWINLSNLIESKKTRDKPFDKSKTRLLVVPPFSGGSLPIAGFLHKAAAEEGYEAELFAWPTGLVEKAEKVRHGRNQKEINELFAESTAFFVSSSGRQKPNLIVALAQAPFTAEALAEIRKTAEATLAFWFVEDYWRFPYFREVAPAYDLVFHIQGHLLDAEIKNLGLSRSWYLPLAADADVFKPENERPEWRRDVTFVGAGYPNRRRLLERLVKERLSGSKPEKKLTIFGSGWEGCSDTLEPCLFEKGRRVTTEECARIYASSVINLNIHSGFEEGFDRRGGFVNPRAFEIAASGGLQIIDRRELLAELFAPDELTIVDSPDELLEAVDRRLADPETSRAMRSKARERALREHLYKHRLNFIIECARSR